MAQPPKEKASKETQSVDINENGRAYPDAVNGLPENYTSKTAADEMAEAKIDRPRLTKLQSAKDADIITACADAIKAIKEYEDERGETNADITAQREKLEAMGIPKAALAIAIKVSKMSNEQMDGFFLALHFLLKAVDQEPKQADLFLGQLGKSHTDTDNAA